MLLALSKQAPHLREELITSATDKYACTNLEEICYRFRMGIDSSHFILSWLVSGLAVLLTSKMVAGFEIRGFVTALIAALLIGLANAVLWPVLVFLTLPLTVITLGLFLFVVNGMILKICAAVLPGFEIKSWLSAIFGAIVLSIVSLILHYFLI